MKLVGGYGLADLRTLCQGQPDREIEPDPELTGFFQEIKAMPAWKPEGPVNLAEAPPPEGLAYAIQGVLPERLPTLVYGREG